MDEFAELVPLPVLPVSADERLALDDNATVDTPDAVDLVGTNHQQQ